MKTKLRAFIEQLAYVPATLRLIWAAAPGWTVAWFVLIVFGGLLPAGTVYLTRWLVDSLVIALDAGLSRSTASLILLPAVLMGLILLLGVLLQSAMNWVRTAQSELVQDYLTVLVHQKSTSVDLAFYETPEYHDRLHRASYDLKYRPLTLLESGSNLAQGLITLIAIGALLIPYGLWLLPVLFLSSLPALYVVLYHSRRYHRWWKQTTAERRWIDYYDAMLTLDTTAAEVRLFDLGPHFQSFFQQLRKKQRTERLALTGQQSLAQLGAGATIVVTTGVLMAWMVWQAFLGLATLGDIALFYQAFSKGQGLLGSLLGNVGRVYDNTLFLGSLFEFLELRPEIVSPPQPILAPQTLKAGIRFRGVTFCYPGSGQSVLADFNFFIPVGKIVAIVGANGAGKTTLVKLLCRLYDPQAGHIELDGIDLRELSLIELRRMITVMFQFPVPYISTVTENIQMGDLAAHANGAAVESAARGAGAHGFIMRLPLGYETLLGKLFSTGVELSGGEWQRLALARSFLRQGSIMILDEPTSAMDSWAEIDWFDRFRELADGRTALLITHRFTTARRADIIHVMDKGRIIESGNHDELLLKNGLYAQSWYAQTQTNAPARIAENEAGR